MSPTAWGHWQLPHIRVGRVPVFSGSADNAIRACVERIERSSGGIVATANLDFLAVARSDGEVASLLERTSFIVADGAPVAWIGRLRGATTMERISGVDLVEGILARTRPAGGLRAVIYGSTAEITSAAATEMQRRHPSISAIHRISPPFRELSEGERRADMEHIAACQPHLVLVALGFPRQERVMLEYQEAAPGAVWIGIGGTLDFYAGVRRRAPRRLQSAGLEWFVRLAQEPRRLWRRYLFRDMPELFACASESLLERLRRA